MRLLALLLLGFGFVGCSNPYDFTYYHSTSRTDDLLNRLHSDYPTLTQIVTIGTSVEGRPIKALKISTTPNTNDPTKGDVVFVGCHHAREWLAVEVPLYDAVHLLADYTANPTTQTDISHLQIWVIPVLNPDGFDYTQTTSRYWRKNRRNNGDGTFGVDLNRNYSYEWALAGISGSPNTGDDTYYGPSPFSEPELQSIRDFMNGMTNLKSFFSYHSFGEFHMKPWAYTYADAPGQPTLHSIATRDIARIQAVHGQAYNEIFTPYNSSGEAGDFWWSSKRIAAITTEVRVPYNGGAPGLAGFSPAATEIIPTCEENYAATLAIIHDAALPHVWLRDYAGDTGAEPSTGYTWESPDIWTVPATLNQHQTVQLHIHINNSSGAAMSNVEVDAYYTDPRITLEFPSPTAVPIGSQTITVPAGGTEVVMPWTTPTGTNSWGELHWCVGAVVKHADDMPLTTIVARSSNIACHNFNTTTVVEGSNLIVAATNFLNEAAELQVHLNEKELPAGWRLTLPTKDSLQASVKVLESTRRKSRLLQSSGILLEPGETIRIPITVHGVQKTDKPIRVRVTGDLLPLTAGKRVPLGNGYSFDLVVGP